MYKLSKHVGALIGNLLEFYDFTIYAFLASILSHEFFNYHEPFLSYLAVFGVLATGYIARPLGALFFGHIGDKKGRSKALSMTLFISTLSTSLIGILPNYQTMGAYSALVLVALRLLQGIAVSGESGVIVLLFEANSFKNKNFIGGNLLASTMYGIILGAIICALSSRFNSSLAWRLPFLLSLPLGLIGIFLRFKLNDFTRFEQAKRINLVVKIPFKTLIEKYSCTLFYAICIVSVYSLTTSTLIVHIPYLLETTGFSHSISLLILIFFLITIALITPLLGKCLSQKNPKTIYNIVAVLLIIISPLLFYSLSIKNIPEFLILGFIFSCLIALISAVFFSIFVVSFPFGVRFSGVTLSYNLCIMLFSSTTPMVLLYLENIRNPAIAGGYLSLMIFLMLLASNYFYIRSLGEISEL